jgi:hypothetical protein
MDNCEDIINNSIKDYHTTNGLELKNHMMSIKEKFQFLDPEA